MTQAPATDTITLQIVACETCDMLFLVSPRRETCPTCGGPPGVEFFTFDATPEGVQLRGGLAVEAASPVPSPDASSNGLPAEDLATVDQDGPVDDEAVETFAASVSFFLEGAGADLPVPEEDLRDQLIGLGAGPGQAAMAVNDLKAIRDLLAELTAGREQPGAAGPEDLPFTPPETEATPGPENGADAPAGEPDDVPEAQTLTESPSQPS